MVPYLIGIAGASGSGKSWLARYLAEHLPATVVPLDAYYRDLSALDPAARARQNFDVPEALDWELILRQAQMLSQGVEIERPVYGFATHTRTAYTQRVQPVEFIIIEGLFALYHSGVRELCGAKVFMSVDDSTCLSRRLERDMRERGRTRESVVAQYSGTVRPMYERYVLPTRQFADLVLCGEEPVEELAAALRRHVERRQP